jgi:hypothetical protein
MKLAISISKAQEGTYPKPTLIIATMMAITTTAITKITINDLSALGSVRPMRLLWEQVLDKLIGTPSRRRLINSGLGNRIVRLAIKKGVRQKTGRVKRFPFCLANLPFNSGKNMVTALHL